MILCRGLNRRCPSILKDVLNTLGTVIGIVKVDQVGPPIGSLVLELNPVLHGHRRGIRRGYIRLIKHVTSQTSRTTDTER